MSERFQDFQLDNRIPRYKSEISFLAARRWREDDISLESELKRKIEKLREILEGPVPECQK